MMKYKHSRSASVLFVVLILASLSMRVTLQAIAQETRQVQVVVTHAPKPALQASVTGEVKPFKLVRGGLKASILAQPMPQVFLVFSPSGQNASKVTVQLPPAAKGTLLECWKAELAFRYKKAFESASFQKRLEDDYALANINLGVLTKLGALEIDTPAGRRKVSEDEAGAIVAFLAQSATDIMEQAKEYKRPKSQA